MPVEPLAVPGAWTWRPKVHRDDRGEFFEWYSESDWEADEFGPLTVAQANASVSARGVLRGLHVTDVPPGQSKYVTCVSGAVYDAVVDLRTGSPTFGAWAAVLLDSSERRCVRLSDGLGHGFLALAPDSVVVYLCSTTYAPDRDRTVHPYDQRIGITWPTVGIDGKPLDTVMSEKDSAAPSLDEAAATGLLPRFDRLSQGRWEPGLQ